MGFPTTRAVVAGQRCGTGPCSPAAGPCAASAGPVPVPPSARFGCPPFHLPCPQGINLCIFVGQGSLFLPAVTNSWVKLLLSALALPSCCIQLRPFLVYLRPLSNDVSLFAVCLLSSLYFLPSHREKETWLLLPINYPKFLDIRFFLSVLYPKQLKPIRCQT